MNAVKNETAFWPSSLNWLRDIVGSTGLTVAAMALIAALTLQGLVQAEDFPHDTVDAMCDEAEVILEGVWLGDNRVKIDRVHKPSPLLKEESGAVEVSQLNEHSRTVGDGFDLAKTPLETKKLVLFLVREKKTGKWESIATINREGQCGSCGLFWFDDATCYGYQQVMNPGPYVLMTAKHSENFDPNRIPKTIQALRKEIEIGLANSREWRRSLAIEDPTQRAQSLARYLLKSSTPKGDKGTYREAVRKPLAALGKDAVPVLIQILRTAPDGERLDTTVLCLYDIGPPAAQALPELHALLTQPDRAFTGYVLSALGSTGDARAVGDLEQYAKSNDERLAKDAKEALARLRKLQSQTPNKNESGRVD